MEGWLPIFFLLVVLKIPVFGALWLVWWAARAEPIPDGAEDEDPGFRRWRPEPVRPKGPRRGGPHGVAANPLPDCSPGGRTRVIVRPAPQRAGAHARGATRPAREPTSR